MYFTEKNRIPGFSFPKIRGIERREAGFFRLPETIRASLGPFSRECLAAFAARTGLAAEAGEPWLYLKKENLPEEGYRLRVEESRITLEAATEKGIIHALTTLFLRLEDGKISCCYLEDSPKHPHRGLSLDCVRHFFPIREVEKVLEQMALVKMNVLHFHLSDDQGWRMESLRFPELHRQSGAYYTRRELKDLVEFARLRGISIIPEIDLPGHTTAILSAYPELGCTGKRPSLAGEGGIYTTILCAGNEAVYRFLEELLPEVMELFPDERFHIGGDEAPKTQWSRCPQCRQRLKALDAEDFEALQTDFTHRVAEILRQHGKRPICWNEALKGGVRAEDMTIQYWTVEGYEQLRRYIREGRPYIYSPMYELYLDYPYAMTPVRKLYKLRLPKDKGLIGLEAALWTEHIAESGKLHRHLFPRLYIAAELGWSGEHGPYRTFLSRLKSLCDLARAWGVTPMPQEKWNPRGRERRTDALDFFQKMNGGVLEDSVPDNAHKTEPDLRMMWSYVTRFFRLSDLPALSKLYFK